MGSVSLEDLMSHFTTKLDNLRMLIELKHAGDEENCQSHLETLNTKVDNLEIVMSLMKTEVAKQKSKLSETQVVKNSISQLISDLRYTADNIPVHLPHPESIPVSCTNKRNTSNNTTTSHPAPRSSSVTRHKSTNQDMCKENRPPKYDQPSKSDQSAVRKHAKSHYIPSLEYVTVDDFETVPKYMKGRITYNQVNSAIDELNKAYHEKYKILGLKKSSMNDVNRKRFEKYKSHESKDTTGEHFIIEEDIKEFANFKMDKVGRSILTILRHCGRLKEIRGGGHTRFASIEVY